jgi:hypothetical protein
MTYRAPVNEMLFMMRHVGELDRAIRDGIYPDVSIDLVQDILGEAARFSGQVLAPINQSGDRHGAQLRDGIVTTAPGFKEAYQAWTAAGWNALGGPVEYGGQGLPQLINAGCFEMWNGACLAFGVAPLLTFGGMETLAEHGSEDLKQRYLSKLVAGEWTATMNLTEPQDRVAGRRDRRARLPGRACFRRRALPRRGAGQRLANRERQRHGADHRACRRAAHAGNDAQPDQRRTRGLLRDRGGDRPLAPMRGSCRAAIGQRARGAIDARRQGVLDRHRRRGRPTGFGHAIKNR